MQRGRLIDLAAERVGGWALAASDEFFAPKENLLRPGRGVYRPDEYTDRGKWMDGWETRRRRGPGHDGCVIRLGIPGVIRGVTVDTNHFRGNHPEACSLDAARLPATSAPDRLEELRDDWVEVLPRSPLQGHTANDFTVHSDLRATHVRLNIYPDGGVARLRVWGEAQPDWTAVAEPTDLVAIQHGGLPLAASDASFGAAVNLIMPSTPANMGDGWETRRRRGPGHDWVVLRLGHRGVIEQVEVDTTHFKGNFPESCSLEGADLPALPPDAAPADDPRWSEILPESPLQADSRHRFRSELAAHAAVTQVRFNIYPDGGVARLRLLGRLARG